MDTALGWQLEPFSFSTTIHAVGTRRGIAIITTRAMAAQQFAFRQPVKKRGVLLVTVDVIHLEMGADSERIDGEDFGAAFDFGKLRGRLRFVAADVRRRICFNNRTGCPPPHVGGYRASDLGFWNFLHGLSNIETVT